jgi:hypothetical protein
LTNFSQLSLYPVEKKYELVEFKVSANFRFPPHKTKGESSGELGPRFEFSVENACTGYISLQTRQASLLDLCLTENRGTLHFTSPSYSSQAPSSSVTGLGSWHDSYGGYLLVLFADEV